MAAPAVATPAQKPSIQQINNAYRAAVVNNAIKIVQPLQSLTFAPGSQATFNFTPRNVGLTLGFIVMVSGNFVTASGTANRTQFGPANVLSNITFNDFNNYQRINVPGWYLNQINSYKARRPYAGAMTLTNMPVNYANNFTVMTAPASVTTTPQPFQMLYYVPVAYSEYDLRGAIYAAVTGGQMNLALTLNPAPWVASGDATLAMYTGGTGGAFSGNVTFDVYQVFYDQLPTVQGGAQNGKVIVPPVDLATTYELHQTVQTNLAQGQENTIAFSNYREFLSTTAVYNNAGVLNNGSDISYWALQAANLLYIFKKEPFIVANDARREIGTDLPLGTYYFSTREKPINTQTFGNMNLVINPSAVTAGANVLVGYETFAQQNVVLGAQAFANG